jgi:hypothetical protein
MIAKSRQEKAALGILAKTYLQHGLTKICEKREQEPEGDMQAIFGAQH